MGEILIAIMGMVILLPLVGVIKYQHIEIKDLKEQVEFYEGIYNVWTDQQPNQN